MADINPPCLIFPEEENPDISNIYNTVDQYFSSIAEKYPSNIAVMEPNNNNTINYQQLAELSSRVSSTIRNMTDIDDNQQGQVVGIYMERGMHAVISMLAILKAEYAYLYLDPSLPSSRLEFIISDANIQLLVIDQSQNSSNNDSNQQEELLSSISQGKKLKLLNILDSLSSNQMAKQASHNNNSTTTSTRNRTGDTLCHVIYTSGSTGKPKGVCISHRGVLSLVTGELNYLRGQSSSSKFNPSTDCFGQLSTLSFDAATFEVYHRHHTTSISYSASCLNPLLTSFPFDSE